MKSIYSHKSIYAQTPNPVIMADPEVRILGGSAEDVGDVEMEGGDSADVMEVGETGADDAPGEEDETALEAERPTARATFVEYV